MQKAPVVMQRAGGDNKKAEQSVGAPGSHLALRFDKGFKSLTLDKVPRPLISCNDEVLVKVAFSGICGTDLHVIHGRYPCKSTAFALGHEFSGVVEEVGSHVTHVKPGDRVTVDPNSGCGQCDSCQSGCYHRCKDVESIGIFRDGGWAQFCTAPKGQVYRLPDAVPLNYGALCEPMSCVAHGWERLGHVPHSSKVLILGAGIIGNLWACLFHLNGHRGNVTVSEPQESRRRLIHALDLGYEVTNPEVLAKRTPRFNLVVDCSGSAAAMQQAMHWLALGGTLCVFGVANPTATMAISPYDVMKKELTIMGVLTNPFSTKEALALLEMMGDRYLDYKRLGVKSFPLEAYKEAMDELEAGSIAKAVFDMTSSSSV